MVTSRTRAPARLPQPGLPGLGPAWSRLVDVDGHEPATWHILDNQVSQPRATLLCIHGNPTWSYLWRDMLAGAPEDVRVIAVDQLDMGFSERTGRQRRLADRVDDLSILVDNLDVAGPIVTVGHDWGGPISLGWALAHRDRLAGVVLANTAVHHPGRTRGSSVLRGVRRGPLRRAVCVDTATFVTGAMTLAHPQPPADIRQAFAAPYQDRTVRWAIGDFVEDIPFTPDHPSAVTLATIAAGVAQLHETPTLLVWGARDPIFGDVFLRDLQRRLPHAATHRYPDAGHMVPEDKDVAGLVFSWLTSLDETRPSRSEAPQPPPSGRRLWDALGRRSNDDAVAIVEPGEDVPRHTTFADLDRRVGKLAAGMAHHGVRHGDRVALLVPPGADLASALHAVWRAGAIAVFVDAGLGAKGIRTALASANPRFLIGNTKALTAAKLMAWPGERLSVSTMNTAAVRSLGVSISLEELGESDAESPEPVAARSDVAAIAFTSGATGPAKGVVYRHFQLEAQRDALMRLYDIGDSDRLVAAFAPFALFGPIMGIASVVPDMDITAPATLTASALADAITAIDATVVFASPAALRNVADTAHALDTEARDALRSVRLCLSAGAPIDPALLHDVAALMSAAEMHTPYGMTEVLPVADISLAQIDELEPGDGVCVGIPVPDAEVAIAPFDATGTVAETLATQPGVVGEVCVRATYMRDGYDQLWGTQTAASRPLGWHRSGDVGRFDNDGRLWIEGRLAHTLKTANGPLTPVPVEHRINRLEDVTRSAIVGVGPPGTQVVVAVIETRHDAGLGLADLALADRVRAVAAVDVAAVVTIDAMPVDIRHNSKINRTRLSAWAEAVCAGERVKAP